MWTMLKSEPKSRQIYDLVQEFDKALGLSLDIESINKSLNEQVEIPQEILDLANERLEARKNRDWAKSDALRDEIKQKGYIIKDSKDSFEITKD